MLYSENELNKRLRPAAGCTTFYAADEALVHTAAQKALKVLNEDDPETTVLDGPRAPGGGDQAGSGHHSSAGGGWC